MKTMREELKRLDPSLSIAFEESMKKATEEWLPSVSPNKDSFNSLPHILGVIRNVDMLLYNEQFGCVETDLSGLEIYILLNAILFHDIGKARQSYYEDKKNIKFCHSVESKKIIDEEWAVLGIKSQRMADLIGNIALYHDYSENYQSQKDEVDYLEDNASVYSYGFVRTKMLAALLFLADRLDNSYSRVTPDYINEDREIVGKFRRHILSTYFHKKYKMLCTVIDAASFTRDSCSGERVVDGVIKDFVTCNRTRDIQSSVQEESDLYIIARDINDNKNDLERIKDELNIMKIPIKNWFIECKGQLFNIEKKGNEGFTTKYALEPILTLDYCEEVFRSIFKLGVGIFVKKYSPYESIANDIHEDLKDIFKVKCAVKRLSRLIRNIGKDDITNIYCDENVWMLKFGNNIPAKIDDYVDEVWTEIKQLVG